MSSSFIEKLTVYCASGDFTDQEKLEDMGRQYCDLCASVNAKCAQLRRFVKNGMRNEAQAWYAQQFPPLQEQVAELNFPHLSTFLGALQVSGFESPEQVDHSVLVEYRDLLQQDRSVDTLITQFRKIARSEDIVSKLGIARQILDAIPESKEWQQIVERLSGTLQQQLVEQAKRAIIDKDFAALATTAKALREYNWSTPLRPEILSKIDSTLHHHEVQEAEAHLREIIEECDQLYRNDLTENLPRLHALVTQVEEIRRQYPDSNIPADLADIFAEEKEGIHKLYEEQRRIAEQDRQYQQALDQLSKLLNDQASSIALQQAYRQLVNFGRDLPEELKYRYQTEFNARTVVEIRRRRVRIMAIATAIALVLIGLGVGLKILSDKKLVEIYDTRLAALLGDPRRPASEAEAVFQEIEKEHPGLLTAARLTARQAQLQEKRTSEQQAISKYQELEAQMLQELADFKGHAASLRETMRKMQELPLASPHREKFQELQTRYGKLERQYLTGQDDAYRACLRQLRTTYRKFFLALDGKGDSTEAETLCAQLEQQRKELEVIAEVSPEVKAQADVKTLLEKVARAREDLRQSHFDKECLAILTVFQQLTAAFQQCYMGLNPQEPLQRQSTDFLKRVAEAPAELRMEQMPAVKTRLRNQVQQAFAYEANVSLKMKNRLQEAAATLQQCETLAASVEAVYHQMQDDYLRIFQHAPLTPSQCSQIINRFCANLPPCREKANLQRFQQEQLSQAEKISRTTRHDAVAIRVQNPRDGTFATYALTGSLPYGSLYALAPPSSEKRFCQVGVGVRGDFVPLDADTFSLNRYLSQPLLLLFN